MTAIGILGGMGPQASAHLQTLLVKDAHKHINIKSDSDFPEIVMISVPVPNFVSDKERLGEVKQILVQRTKLLEKAGSVVNGIACNTAHLLLPDLQAATSVPFVSIPRLVNETLLSAGVTRVGLLATPNTLRSRLYDDALDETITLVRPSWPAANEIEGMILARLQSDTTNVNDKRRLREIVEQFISDNDLNAVILGCTELPLVFGDTDDPRIVSSLQVLSDELLREFAIRVKN